MLSPSPSETLAFKNPNDKTAVIKKLDGLIAEWHAWQKEVSEIKDHPYDRMTQSQIYLDGEENITKHRILQEKTLVFLENNIAGHGFITGRDGTKIDRTDLRLTFRVKHRVDDLDELRACLEYAGTTMSGHEDWITANSAFDLLDLGNWLTGRTICQRAYAGLIKARAERFVRDGQSADNVEIPREFWWAKGGAALTQNWATGDFDTWIEGRIHLEAFGVTFWRSDIERLMPAKPAESIKSIVTARKVFIGHGHSLVWRELKDFLEDRLNLSTDDFNSVSAAGVTTTNRLEEMLGNAAFAFLILTAEDEQADGKLHARLNVVHEAGLFQGRLGFKRAIILREETCEEFSNIHGLGQIPFPPRKISGAFEEIRRVLEREALIANH